MNESQRLMVQIITTIVMMLVSFYVLIIAWWSGVFGGSGLFGSRANLADYIPLVALVVLWVVYAKSAVGSLKSHWMWLAPALLWLSARVSYSIGF